MESVRNRLKFSTLLNNCGKNRTADPRSRPLDTSPLMRTAFIIKLSRTREVLGPTSGHLCHNIEALNCLGSLIALLRHLKYAVV